MKIYYPKIFILATIFVVSKFSCVAANSSSSDSLWLTDFDKALKIAKETKKPILLDFTGSDWCGWCIRLDKEVFSKNSFKSFAKKNLVLVEIDFPRKNNQDSFLRKQNNRLKAKYEVRGFPTIVLLDFNGNLIDKTGYVKGGSSRYISHLKKLLKQ